MLSYLLKFSRCFQNFFLGMLGKPFQCLKEAHGTFFVGIARTFFSESRFVSARRHRLTSNFFYDGFDFFTRAKSTEPFFKKRPKSVCRNTKKARANHVVMGKNRYSAILKKNESFFDFEIW